MTREQREKRLLDLKRRELESILDEDKVDWDKLQTLVGTPGLNPNVENFSSKVTTAHRAAYDGQAQVLRWCFKSGQDPDAKTTVGRSILHMACDGNSMACIRELLQTQADVNAISLSHQTPLHIACQAGSYDAVLVMLDESLAGQVVDVDALDSRLRAPDQLTQNKKILRAVKKYRQAMNCKKKEALIERKVWRLFKIIDRDSSGFISSQEWVDVQALLARLFDSHCSDSIDDAFEKADANHDGKVDWEEFKESYIAMIGAAKVSQQELMSNLCDVESQLFQSSVKQRLSVAEAIKLPPDAIKLPPLSPTTPIRPTTPIQPASPKQRPTTPMRMMTPIRPTTPGR